MNPRSFAALLAALAVVAAVALLLGHPWAPVRPPLEPPDFQAIADTAARKEAFLGWLAPVVQRENAQLARVRARLERLAQAPRLRPSQERAVAALAAHYQVDGELPPREQLQRLLRRVDTIPPRLALAQAAVESAWGTSRFAREAANYFGIWTWRGDGLVPARREQGARHRVARYPDAAASVRVYLYTLNVGPAYRTLRDLRAEARAAGRRPRAAELAAGLAGYSARGDRYVAELRAVLAGNADLLDRALEGR